MNRHLFCENPCSAMHALNVLLEAARPSIQSRPATACVSAERPLQIAFACSNLASFVFGGVSDHSALELELHAVSSGTAKNAIPIEMPLISSSTPYSLVTSENARRFTNMQSTAACDPPPAQRERGRSRLQPPYGPGHGGRRLFLRSACVAKVPDRADEGRHCRSRSDLRRFPTNRFNTHGKTSCQQDFTKSGFPCAWRSGRAAGR